MKNKTFMNSFAKLAQSHDNWGVNSVSLGVASMVEQAQEYIM